LLLLLLKFYFESYFKMFFERQKAPKGSGHTSVEESNTSA